MTLCKLLYIEKVPIMNCIYTRTLFAPITSKRGTLRTIFIRPYKICSTKELLQNELKQIEKELIKLNVFLKLIFDQVNKECRLPRNAD